AGVATGASAARPATAADIGAAPPRAAAGPSVAPGAAVEERRDDGHSEPAEHDEEQQKREGVDGRTRGGARSRLLVRAGDGLADRVEPRADAVGDVPLAEARRDHVAQDRRRERVRQVRLETVPDLDPHLPVVDEDEEDDAVVEALLPDPPHLGQPDGEV